MKRTLLLSVAALFALGSIAQSRLPIPASIKNQVSTRPIHVPIEYENNNQANQALPIPQLHHSKSVTIDWAEIGTTTYDLQSNATVDHRTYLYSDGTVGATWTMSQLVQSAGWADRGSGYNYFDGTTWLSNPTARVESIRTGWPCYAPLGTGEIIISHSGGATGMRLSKRAVKGTGTWTQTPIAVPAGAVAANAAVWPRICTVGTSIHILCAGDTSATTATGFGGQHNPLFYYRSTDGGATWDKAGVSIPGLDNAFCHEGFGGDIYSWAEPKAGKLAFVIGDTWTDLILMKSDDNGNTWTKTTIFAHPYGPCWNDNILTQLPGGIADTPYVADGTHAVELDASGKAHVVFGVLRVLNDVAGDNSTSFFGGVDGIGYWKEGDAAITSMNPDSLYAKDKLLAWVQDRNGNGTVFENFVSGTTDFPLYYHSLSSQPQLTIDANDHMYLTYKSVCEDMLSTTSSQYYSHIWARSSTDGGATWGSFQEITGGSDFDFFECIFPATSKTCDNKIHLTCQEDVEPGLMVNGDADAPAFNSIIYVSFDKSQLEKVNVTNISGSDINIYPNPVSDNMNVSLKVNKSTNVTMTIVNLVGATVMSQQFVSERGTAKEINVSSLSTGIYLAKFETAKGTYTQKIMKQ